jgi:hypothetical protein
MRRLLNSASVLVIGLVFFSAVGGCACRPGIQERDVQITVDDALIGQPVELNLYAANVSDRDLWRSIPVDQYFGSGSSLRRGTSEKAVIAFEPGGRARTKVLKARGTPESDRLWANWKARGGWDLVLLAYIPNAPRHPGDPQSDPRRLVLPLDRCRWEDASKPIEIRVHRGSITNETPFLASPKR